MKVWEERAKRLERKLAALRHKYANKKPKTAEHAKCREDAISSFQKSILWAHSEAGVWRSSIDLYGGDVDGAIACAIASAVEREALSNRFDRMAMEADNDAE